MHPPVRMPLFYTHRLPLYTSETVRGQHPVIVPSPTTPSPQHPIEVVGNEGSTVELLTADIFVTTSSTLPGFFLSLSLSRRQRSRFPPVLYLIDTARVILAYISCTHGALISPVREDEVPVKPDYTRAFDPSAF